MELKKENLKTTDNEYQIKNINNNIYSVINEEIDLDIEIKIEEDEDFETDLITINPESPKCGDEGTNYAQNHSIKEELVNLPEEIEEKIIHVPLNLINEETYQCTVCKKNLKTKRNLHYHLQEKHSLKPCQFCLKIFNKTSNVKRHQDYFCPLNEIVPKNNEVRKYGEFPHRFICDYCNKSYAHKNYLQQHIARHMGKSNYQCKYCTKSYTKQHNLTCHIRSTHLKVKNYSCGYCKKKFAWRYSLTSHENTQHKNIRKKKLKKERVVFTD